MKTKLKYLLCRDLKRAFSLRTIFIWICMAAFCIFFFFTSSGKRDLVQNNKVNFMTIMLPQIIFGAWAVLSTYFDLVSADREHNVLDCIICSGTKKKQIFLSKVFTLIIVSLVLSIIYLLPITIVIINISREASYFVLFLKYLLPLWTYIMVFAAIGLTISIIARSSKTAMIWSIACGLVLMPRFFILIIDGIGAIFNWSQAIKDTVSMISPGVLMGTLSGFSNTVKFINAAAGFSLCIIIFLLISFLVFSKQDELNYGQ